MGAMIMNNYIVDNDGKKEIIGSFGLLYVGNESEQYLNEKKQEEQRRLEEELFNSLLPTEKELIMAEIELNIINLLIESEVI